MKLSVKILVLVWSQICKMLWQLQKVVFEKYFYRKWNVEWIRDVWCYCFVFAIHLHMVKFKLRMSQWRKNMVRSATFTFSHYMSHIFWFLGSYFNTFHQHYFWTVNVWHHMIFVLYFRMYHHLTFEKPI